MKVCAEPGCPALIPKRAPEGRCQQHRRYSPTGNQARNDWAERKRRAAAVAAHVAVSGWWCPGYGEHRAHPSNDLTAAHVVSVVNGGGDGPLRVLCRSENSRLGASDQF